MSKNRSEEPTPGAATTAGRLQTLERRRELQRRKRRQQQFAVGAAVSVIGVIALLAFIIINQPLSAPIPTTALGRYTNLPTTVNNRGFPRLGNTANAVPVLVYASFSHPNTKQFSDTILDSLLQRVEDGEITLTFVPLTRPGNISDGTIAARAALCAAEQRDGAGFWSLHDSLLAWQQFGAQAFAPRRINQGVEGLGLNVQVFQQCFNSNRLDNLLQVAQGEAEALSGFQGSPTVTVNGVIVDAMDAEAINAAIDNALALVRARAEATSEVEAVDAVTEEATTGEVEEVETLEPTREAETETPEPEPTDEPEPTEAAATEEVDEE